MKDAAVLDVTGVDMVGPLHLKERRNAWILLYNCAVYRTVHLELLHSLSTLAFLQGFREFITRQTDSG